MHSENNIPKGIKDLKSNGGPAPRRPALNDIINSNLQTNQKGKTTLIKPTITVTKPTTRIAAKYV